MPRSSSVLPEEAQALDAPEAPLLAEPAAPHGLQVLRAILPHGLEIGVASLLVNACGLMMPVFSMLVYDKVVGNGNNETLWTLAIGMALILSLEFGLRLVRGQAAERLGAMAELRMDGPLADRLLAASAQQVAAPGMLMSRFRDMAGARDALLAQYAVVAADLPFLLMYLLALGFIGGPLVGVPLVATVPLLAGQWLASRPQRDYLARVHEAAAQKSALLADLTGGLAWLQTTELRHAVAGRWEDEVQRGALLRCRQRFWQTASQAWGGLCIGLASVALLAGGVYRIEAGAMSVGALIACSLIQLRAMLQLSSVVALALGWKDLARTQQALDGAARPVAATARPDGGPLVLDRVSGEVSARRLRCEGNQGEVMLDDLSLLVAPGERVALVGRPGSGKSTLLRCLAGVQALAAGEVLLDGARLGAVDADDRARWLAYKPQEPVMLGPLLQDDLAPLQGTRAEDSLAATGLAAALRNGEMRRDQRVGSGAAQTLSGGQRQMLALARVLAQDAQVYLLDEPTSGVDAETEARLAEAVERLTRGRTVVIATHSTAVLQKVDRIVVLERGKVIASGPRAQMLGQRPAPAPAAAPAAAAIGTTEA